MSNVEALRAHIDATDRFMVTGATGWLGRSALDVLERTLGTSRFTRDVIAYAGTPRPLELQSGTTVESRALDELADDLTGSSHLLHFAFMTKDRAGEGDAYIRGNLAITAVILDALARSPRSLIYASSGAVYASDDHTRFETALDRNPYGALKYIDELAFRQACVDARTRCVIARVFAIGGAYMTKPNLYALGDLITQAQTRESIEIRAKSRVVRSYALAADVVSTALAAALDPSRSLTMFDSGGDVVEVGQLADAVQRIVGTSLPVVRAALGDARDDLYVGDQEAITELARAYGLQLSGLDSVVAETAAWLSSTAD